MLEPDDLINDAEIIAVNKMPMRNKPKIFSAADLALMSFPEPRFIVPGIVPEGLTILTGAPKIGKSWMALGMCLAVANGRSYLGRTPCDKGNVLYLALEDSDRRLKSRMRQLYPDTSSWPKEFAMAVDWHRLDEGGLEDVSDWATSATNPRLVVIDVMTLVRPSRSEGRNQYQADLSFLSKLRTLASSLNIGILAIHHNRKAVTEFDPFERVSGTFGLTGAADTTLILDRDGHGVSLYGRGRDIAEFQRAVSLNQETLCWEDLGEASDVFRSPERKKIIDFLASNPNGVRPEDIASVLGAKRNNIEQLLFKMTRDGSIVKLERGVYALTDNLISPYKPQ